MTEQELERIAQRVADILAERARVSAAQRYIPCREMRPDVRAIVDVVSATTGVPVSDILSARRSVTISRARHIAVYITIERTPLSLTQIGNAFDRDHTSILHARRCIERALSEGNFDVVGAYAKAKETLDKKTPSSPQLQQPPHRRRQQKAPPSRLEYKHETCIAEAAE